MDIRSVVEVKQNPKVAQVSPGTTVKVSCKVVEAEKQRIQTFQGMVIRVRKGGVNASFTVRRVLSGVGVERTFFFQSPFLEEVVVLRHGKVRRARLYYQRKLSGKAIRLKEKRTFVKPANAEPKEPSQ